MKGLSPSFIAVNKTDQQGRASQARMKSLQDGKVLWNKTRLKKQILRRISRDRQLRSQNQLRARSSETLVSVDDLLEIAAQISDSRVKLTKTDLHAAHRRLCATQPTAILFSCVESISFRLAISTELSEPSSARRIKDEHSPESPLLCFHDPEP